MGLLGGLLTSIEGGAGGGGEEEREGRRDFKKWLISVLRHRQHNQFVMKLLAGLNANSAPR